ncbi:MAG: adenine deaminase [Chitinophagaceae bacterium]|nr:adenine deaminase [Chitinophagaceae bacterium]
MQTTYYHNLIDLHAREIYPAAITIKEGKILSITKTDQPCANYILPGLIDAHIHIESSMLIPSEFARIAVKHGTVATISDPHEIANVCGIPGVEYMLDNAARVPFKFHFGAPSCVPATSFETSGAIIDAEGVNQLLKRDDIFYLSEMMNYPGVLMGDEQVLKKIAYAKDAGKPVDGHAPGLMGEKAHAYIAAGISTDHECFTREEAEDKLAAGMKILIREGSAAKNFEALIDLLPLHPDLMMFCCDDKHPDELLLHHINDHVKRALAKGIDIFTVLRAACVNPAVHYGMKVGLLREGDPADFIIIDHPDSFEILRTVIDGQIVYEQGQCFIDSVQQDAINAFDCRPKHLEEFAVPCTEKTLNIRVIEALDGQLITRTCMQTPRIENNLIVSDPQQDVLKMVVVNRYQQAPVAKAFIKNFGLHQGAIASTVAHDSHNIICVGCSDEEILMAVNALIECKGGIVVYDGQTTEVMPLPVAGLMSTLPAAEIGVQYAKLDAGAKALGSKLSAPFMTLSFMALLVIPQLKLSDLGLFDGERFEFVDLF